MADKSLNWVILGTGSIANEMAAAFNKMGKNIYAVANRTNSKAVDFAKKYNIKKVYNCVDDMFCDSEVDIIYVATPHNTHYQLMKKAVENKKHLLVEKAITLNSDELDDIFKIANKNNVVLAEAMTIWHMPIFKKLQKILDNNELGKVQIITTNFGSFKEYDIKNRFFNINLGGGALLDIGVYALSLVRFFLSEAPTEILSQIKKSPTGSDEQDTILLKNSQNQMATVALSLHSKQPKRAMISFEKGYIEIMEYPRGEKAIITNAESGEKREIDAGKTEDALCYEITDMEDAVLKNDFENMKLNYTKDVMDIMTKLRKDWNLIYPEEK